MCNELKKHTDREIKVRNKPRPNNEWWGTDIKAVSYTHLTLPTTPYV